MQLEHRLSGAGKTTCKYRCVLSSGLSAIPERLKDLMFNIGNIVELNVPVNKLAQPEPNSIEERKCDSAEFSGEDLYLL